jgi:Fic family protein
MDADEFAAEQREHLVRIPGGLAFLPPPVPRDLELPRQVARLEASAHREIGALEVAAAGFTTDHAVFPLRLREARLSNEIEGTHTQVEELLTAVAVPRKPASEAVREVLATADALETGLGWIAQGHPINDWLLRSLHARILASGRGAGPDVGAYRLRQVVIGRPGEGPAEARFVPPPPEHVAPALDDLFAFVRDEVYGPVVDAAVLHYQFEAIHPFEDGNGRLGRALVPLLWVQRGFLKRPLVYLGAYLAERRSEYLDRLLRVSTHGDWLGWIEFFARGVELEARDTRERLEAVGALLERYRQEIGRTSKSPTARDTIPLLLEQPMVTVAAVAKYTGASRPAAQQAIEALVKVGALEPVGRVSGAAAYLAAGVARLVFARSPVGTGEG